MLIMHANKQLVNSETILNISDLFYTIIFFISYPKSSFQFEIRF